MRSLYVHEIKAPTVLPRMKTEVGSVMLWQKKGLGRSGCAEIQMGGGQCKWRHALQDLPHVSLTAFVNAVVAPESSSG
jgi:hypothetical protein